MHNTNADVYQSQSEPVLTTISPHTLSCCVKRLALLLSVALLSACATQGEASTAGASDQNIAIILPSFHRESTYRWSAFTVYSANGVKTPIGFISNLPAKVAAGKSNLVVHASFNLGTGPASEAKIPLVVELKPGVTYEVKGSASGTGVEAWLVDTTTNEKISDTASASSTMIPQAPTLIRFTLPK